MKRILSILIVLTIVLTSFSVTSFAAEEKAALPTITVDMKNEQHNIIHGAAGFLYGISNEGVPDVNTLTPLKPKVLATKGALGTEHPYGDALDVAEEFFEAGGEQVQMYNSNYYGVFGVTADAYDYADVLKNIICPEVVAWKEKMRDRFPDIDKMLQYIPINESTPIKVSGSKNYNEAWKIYYKAIKEADPNATVVGPNHAYDPSYNEMLGFLNFCKTNDCLPDVITWHELQVSDLNNLNINNTNNSIQRYRSAARDAGVEEKQVVINEYADFADCGVPGRLVNWIARLEDNQVYGCLPFWHQANNLNDLAANANQGNGAWWVYKWYGDMSGKTLGVEQSNTSVEGFYGVASYDKNKRSASVLCGGTDGEAIVKLDNISSTSVFKDADKVHIKVEASYFSGYHGAVYAPETVMEGVFPVNNGSVTINLEDMLFSAAYNITITETTEDVSEPAVGAFRSEYEAENATPYGSLIIDNQDTPLEEPRYFCSGGVRIGGIDQSGDGIEYNIDVPVDGHYRLDFLYGNGVGSTRNNANTHSPKNITQKLVIDGAESELLLPNTLFYSMEGMVPQYADLKAGHHKIALMYNGEAGGFHDALYVSYTGAYGEEYPEFDKIYEAESADFNALGETKESFAVTETAIDGYSSNGYVTRLNLLPVTSGGGIRWIVDVEESGLYDLEFKVNSANTGKLNVYIDNTNLTFDNFAVNMDIKPNNDWQKYGATLFLRQGINIVDIDTDCEAAVDYMHVIRSDSNPAVVVEAEDAQGKFETAISGDATYVKEMRGDEYLEMTVNAKQDGLYKMQVFQSNDDLCGTHSYNIKIIDRYATVEVNGEQSTRYFFPNSFSDDTFLERTVPIELKAGENKIRIYNDDSWHVKWGGTTSTPGTNELVNYTPNFDKFIITPASIQWEAKERSNTIFLSSTKNGYIYCDKNTAYNGETATVYLVPDGEVKSLTLNGKNITQTLSTEDYIIYKTEIEINGDTNLYAEFTPAIEGDFDKPIIENPGTVVIDGKKYKKIGENLFKNHNFADYSGADMEQWYVGVNNGGHPTAENYQIPKINPDGSVENLVPIAESGLLTTGGYEKTGEDTFYYGKDKAGRTYLVEQLSSDWQNCAWNGAHSLLGFIPIKPNKNYYFQFEAFSSKKSNKNTKASVRYGAINMENFVPKNYTASGTLNFSGTGYMTCKNGDEQNIGGNSWETYDALINSGDGDYFLFNAYWLHMAHYMCFGDFQLYELSDTPMVNVSELKNPAALVLNLNDKLSLADKASIVADDGETSELPITWLNANGVDITTPGVYVVTGYVSLPDDYYSDNVYVKQKVIVKGIPAAEITKTSKDGNKVGFCVNVNSNCSGVLYVAVKDDDGKLLNVKSKEIELQTGETYDAEFEFAGELNTVEIFFWEKDTMRPFCHKVTI